jgi:hypothetical protein
VASHTINGQAWPSGTLVSVYSANALPVSGDGTPVGVAITSATVSGSSVTFSGLSENVRYLAYAAGVGKRFLIPQQNPMDARSLRARVDELEGDTLPAVQDGIATLDTSDVTMDDAVALNVAGTKKRRVPIADKMVYDLREFYAGTAQPSDVLGHIHDMLARTSLNGGWGEIPEGFWEVSGPIIPPPNSKLRGIGTHGSTTEHNGALTSSRGPEWFRLPNIAALGASESWIALKSGSNAPILKNDLTNAVGKQGPPRGSTEPWIQNFLAQGLVLDHNGGNQVWTDGAVQLEDAGTMSFRDVRLVNPRGRGFNLLNCYDCNGLDVVVAGVTYTQQANGVGDLASSTTISNATGTWAKGDKIEGTGIPANAYLTNVVGATLTLSAAATVTATGATLTKTVYFSDYHLAMTDSTVDCQWDRISMHAAKSIVLLDSAYANRVSGFAGYAMDGYNLEMKDSYGASSHYIGGCIKNYVNLRCEQATKHNVRIGTRCVENNLDLVAYSAGQYGRAADSDGGWYNIFNDGQLNTIKGAGGAGFSHPVTMAGLYADGPSADGNEVSFVGKTGPPSGTSKYFVHPSAKYKSRIVGMPEPIVWGASELGAHEGTPVIAGVASNAVHAFLLDPAASESVGKWFIPPPGTSRYNVELTWINPTAGAGDVAYAVQASNYADADTVGAAEFSTSLLTFTAPAINVVKKTAIAQVTAATPGQATFIRVRRVATDVGDTLAADIGLVAVEITPLNRIP